MFRRVDSERYIEFLEISDAEKSDIERSVDGYGTLNAKTLVDGEGNYAGFAGERLLQKYMGELVRHENSIDYDFLAGALKIDVKSKGNCKSKPTLSYDCTIPYYQLTGQQAEVYVFARISDTRMFGWLCGWITKKAFLDRCSIRCDGQAYNNDGRESVGSHGVVTIDQTYRMRELREYLKQRSS